jgi:cell division protein FtsB
MRRLFPVLILVFSVASLLIYLFGDSGLLSYAALSSYRERLSANVADLEARHGELQGRLAAVRSDPETAKVMARSQGYFEPGDQVVKIEGTSSPRELNVVGDLLRYRKPSETRNAAIKSAAAGIALTLLAWAFLRARRGRKRAHADPLR